MRLACLILLVAALAAPIAHADGEPAGRFDYYLLSLSWSPGWCAAEGDADGAAECRRGSGTGFVLHGLWPQYETGWPAYCRTEARDPTRTESAAAADVFGSAGLAWYQWKKHGRCSGLSPTAYFDTARRAFALIRRPEVFSRLTKPVRIAPGVVEAAFLESNPTLSPDMLTVTCQQSRMREVRICLTRDLSPRACGADTRRDCPLRDMAMEPLR